MSSFIEVELLFNFFFLIFTFEKERKTEHEAGRGREKERQDPKQAPGSKLSAQSPTGLKLTNPARS